MLLRKIAILTGLFGGLISLPFFAEDVPAEAVCVVCAVHEGSESPEPEKVKAWSEYEGQKHYFCSKDCKEKFDADPLGYLPPEFPFPAPDVGVQRLDGENLSLTDYRGKVVLLDFWATWCAPCLKMMPALQKLHEKYAAAGLVVLGISIDEGKDASQKVEKVIRKKSVQYPIARDVSPSPAWAAFRVKAIPVTYLIDANGQVVTRWLGRLDHQQAEEKIRELLAEIARPESEIPVDQ